MGNESTEPKMLANMRAVMVTTQNILINNFLCMRHRKAESVWLYLDHLKGAARHWDFNLPTGHTSFTNKMFLHILVQGLEYAATAQDVMEEYGTNNDLQNHIKVSNYH